MQSSSAALLCTHCVDYPRSGTVLREDNHEEQCSRLLKQKLISKISCGAN